MGAGLGLLATYFCIICERKWPTPRWDLSGLSLQLFLALIGLKEHAFSLLYILDHFRVKQGILESAVTRRHKRIFIRFKRHQYEVIHSASNGPANVSQARD